jgi:uridine phosphorylase
MISGPLEGADRLAANREYLGYRGSWSGTDVLVSSQGLGAAGSLQLLSELIAAGVGTIVRLGGAGSVPPGIENDDIVMAEAAVRDDGVPDQIVPPHSFPNRGDAELPLIHRRTLAAIRVRTDLVTFS